MLGIWMWADSVAACGADRVFDDCALIGVTDVFFLTKGLSGRCAFDTRLAPAMAEGRDLLSEAVKAAHARGMRLHTWFTSAQDKHWCAEHPENGLYHLTQGRSDRVVSITEPEYARFMHDVVADMLKMYDVDGVHLDYIRYNHLLYGWSDGDLERYAKHGADTSRLRELVNKTFYGGETDKQAVFEAFRRGDKDVCALVRTRIENLCRFADAVLEGVRQARPGITLSAALMPEGAYDTVFAHLHYGQSYAELAGRFDMILPMAYSFAYGMDSEWVKKVTQGAARFGAKVLTGLHAYDGATALTLRRDADAALEIEGAEGVCLFRYGAFVPAAVKADSLTVVNPTDVPVTELEISNAAETQRVKVLIAPGERAEKPLPFAADTLRAWSGEKEICAYLG